MSNTSNLPSGNQESEVRVVDALAVYTFSQNMADFDISRLDTKDVDPKFLEFAKKYLEYLKNPSKGMTNWIGAYDVIHYMKDDPSKVNYARKQERCLLMLNGFFQGLCAFADTGRDLNENYPTMNFLTDLHSKLAEVVNKTMISCHKQAEHLKQVQGVASATHDAVNNVTPVTK